MIVLLGRWYWKCDWLVTQGRTLLSTFIVKVSWETELLDRVLLSCKDCILLVFTLGGVVVLKGLTLDDFYFWRVDGLERTTFQQFPL